MLGSQCIVGESMQGWGVNARLGSQCNVGESMQGWGFNARLGIQCKVGETMQGWGVNARLLGWGVLRGWGECLNAVSQANILRPK